MYINYAYTTVDSRNSNHTTTTLQSSRSRSVRCENAHCTTAAQQPHCNHLVHAKCGARLKALKREKVGDLDWRLTDLA